MVNAFQTPVDDSMYPYDNKSDLSDLLSFDIDRVAKDQVIPRKQLHDSCLDINMKAYIKSSMVSHC